MAWILDSILAILDRPNTWRIVSELLLFASPLWLAVFIGLLVGWTWKPDWAAGFVGGVGGGGIGGSQKKVLCSGSGSDWQQLPAWRGIPKFDFWRQREANTESRLAEDTNGKKLVVTGADLLYLYRLVEETDGGPTWQHMMNRSLPNMSYQAWRREPENGPTEYRSSTIFENATPEQVRDFFWDDEFRISNKWDDMLIHYQILEECRTTGTTIVHWVRKFPFFCSDREYIIGRRIWNLEGTYFCLTKAVPCSAVQRRNKPRRVDVYFSSWCIRAVQSKRSDGLQKTACEVLLFHHEDMGIPKEIAKLGIRQGMWGCVKRIEPGLRAYQKAQLPLHPDPLSQINTKITKDLITSLEDARYLDEDVEIEGGSEDEEGGGKVGHVQKLPRFLLIGGAMVLACSLNQGLLTKAVIFGVARRFVLQKKRA